MNNLEEDDSSSIGDENLFEVEKILAMKEEFGMRRYLIKWKHYDDSENSWEPEDNLSCPELLEHFRASQNKKPSPPTLRVKLGSLTSTSSATASSSSSSSTSNSTVPAKRPLLENKQTSLTSSTSVEPPPPPPPPLPEEPPSVDEAQTKKIATDKFKSMSPVTRVQNERSQPQHTPQRRETNPIVSASPSSSSIPAPPSQSSTSSSTSSSTTTHRPLSLSISRSRDPRLASHQLQSPQRQTSSSSLTNALNNHLISRLPSNNNNNNIEKSSPPPNAHYTSTPQNDNEPISWSGKITGNIEPSADIQMISVPTKCPRSSVVKEFLSSSERLNGGTKTLRLTAFIKVKVLERFFHVPACLLDLNHAGSNRIGYGKLSRFLQVNDVAGLVHLDGRPTDVLAVVYCTDMMASGWKLGFRPSKTLLGIFLEQMPKYPQFPRLTIELKDWPLLKSSSCKSYDWQLLLISLQFPTHLIKKIHPESQLSIYGTSSWATMLQNAHKLFKAGVKREYLRILLFDRSDDSIMNVDLYRYKRSQWITKFFLFGFLSPTQSSIPPPTEAFPRNSGGFMITDAENIIQNPSILTKISDAIDSLNKNPLTFSRWRFVLQDDIFTHLQARATTSKNAVKIQEAIVNLSILLSQNQCEVMRNWVVDDTVYPNASTSTMKWAEKLVRRYHTEYEYFVLVDDIETMNQHLPCLNQTRSNDLVNQFMVTTD